MLRKPRDAALRRGPKHLSAEPQAPQNLAIVEDEFADGGAGPAALGAVRIGKRQQNWNGVHATHRRGFPPPKATEKSCVTCVTGTAHSPPMQTMEREAGTLAGRIQDRLATLDLSAHEASRRASNGRNTDFVRDILKGRTRHPRIDTLQKLATVLQCSVQYLMGEDQHVSPLPLSTCAECPGLARRLRAARWAYEPDDRKAAHDFGTTVETLLAVESGHQPPGNDFLLRFSGTTQTPLEWLFLGKVTSSMHPVMAARIALVDPGVLGVGFEAR